MRGFMKWTECEREYVRRVAPDSAKISSLLDTSEKRVGFLAGIAISGENLSFILEGFYEALKELLTALMLKDGMRSSNHQCLISYFYRKHQEHEGLAHFLLQLNYMRNRLNYYGELADPQFYLANEGKIKEALKVLNGLVRNGGEA